MNSSNKKGNGISNGGHIITHSTAEKNKSNGGTNSS